MTKAGQLFDAIRQALDLRSDAELADALDVDPPFISRLRHGHRQVSEGMVLSLHDLTGWAIRDIKGALGMRCREQIGTYRLQPGAA